MIAHPFIQGSVSAAVSLLEHRSDEVRVTLPELALATLSAVAAGLVNALAGGGTLLSFPVLLALGVPPIAANVTNAVALCPGYFGATLAQRQHLAGQRVRLWVCIPAALAGGLLGATILLATRERTFQLLVPYMIAAAAVLLAVQERVRAMVLRRLQTPAHASHATWAGLAVLLAGIYGGFFSAGMSVIVLAVLGITLDDTLTRLNALKQAVALSVNVAATVFFLFSGEVIWGTAAVMAVGALLGGALGGRLAGKMQPGILRWTVVVTGLLVAGVYWMR
jgi:uncharacterized protein